MFYARFAGETLWKCEKCRKSDVGRTRSRILVVCFDGTGKKFDTRVRLLPLPGISRNWYLPQTSNVVKFFSELIDDEDQITYYQSGVGTYAKYSRKAWRYLKIAVDSAIDKGIAW